jgi:hypothetical protein
MIIWQLAGLREKGGHRTIISPRFLSNMHNAVAVALVDLSSREIHPEKLNLL